MIYARQIAPEYQESRIFDDDGMGPEYINVTGNRDYKSRTSSLFDRVWEALRDFEIEYFNTGSKWIIHDEEGEPESPEDISGYSLYCHGWDVEQIRREIAEAAGGKPEDVRLYEFEGWARSPVYREAC